MTSNESFKKRIRARMAETGEKYNAARRVLIEQAGRRRADDGPGGVRTWVSRPEVSDDAVRAATGRTWDGWVDLIEDAPIGDGARSEVVRWLVEHHLEDHWWAQQVTGGWERITGRRLPGQMPDGTFTVNRSLTTAVDVDELRSTLLDEDGRRTLFPDLSPTLRSRPTSKSVRIGLEVGVALFSLTPRDDGRTTVTVAHEQLPDTDEVELWRTYWGDWLDALAPVE